jgi:predicted ABC-type sugar transport system permease subunit
MMELEKKKNKFVDLLLGKLGILPILVVVFVFFAIAGAPRFTSTYNLLNIFLCSNYK